MPLVFISSSYWVIFLQIITTVFKTARNFSIKFQFAMEAFPANILTIFDVNTYKFNKMQLSEKAVQKLRDTYTHTNTDWTDLNWIYRNNLPLFFTAFSQITLMSQMSGVFGSNSMNVIKCPNLQRLARIETHFRSIKAILLNQISCQFYFYSKFWNYSIVTLPCFNLTKLFLICSWKNYYAFYKINQ